MSASIRTKLRKLSLRFLRGRGGNVAITFALATLPIIGGVGAAIDFSHANSVKTAMQSALDSTALMLARDAATVSNAQLQTKALSYFSALFTRPEAKNIVISATYSSSGGSSLVVNGTATVDTSLMAIAGYTQMPVSGTAMTKWGNTRLRVALVLDNTGSMAANGKMTALITATKSLLTQLQSAVSTNGDVYVSIVPFVKDVNVDSSNYKSKWIDWTDWDANNGWCTPNQNSQYTTQSDCLSQGQKKPTWHPNNHNTWNGCVTDRGASNAPSILNTDTNVTAPLPLVTDTQYSAEQYSPCPQAVMPLSYDWSGMTSLVNSMSPGGNTNQAIGLQLGWMSLVGGGPFPTPPAMDPLYTYTQVIILLTDGLNTQNRWYTSQSSIDARQQLTCNNIKAANITLYTIQVNTGGDPTSTLLQNCATTSDKFYLLTSANEIISVFNQIGTNLSKLYVAK
ncbi:MAG: pilus assembly protein TadG-related protein [Pseudolabrys sp.]